MFAPYIPTDRRLAVAKGSSLPANCVGSALFADISGFTHLVDSQIDEFGARKGAEEVSRTLNTVFTALIGALHRYGGSVIHFSGDAITCWFDETGPGEAGQARRRAITAGLAMQKSLATLRYNASASDPLATLELTIAVTYGPARRFLVGAPELLQLDVITGTPLDKIAIAEEIVSPGEFVVCPDVLASSELDLIVASEKKHGFKSITDLHFQSPEAHWDTEPNIAPGEGWEFVRSEIREHLKLSEPMLGDLRKVSPVFCSIEGIDYSDPLAAQTLDKAVRVIQKHANECGGALHELSIGEKSTYLYLVFGAPLANADDCSRSLRAAELVHRSSTLAQLGLRTRIGVSRGRVFTGICGGSGRTCYAIIGREVNIAARLMGHASPEHILVTEEVVSEVADAHTFKELPAVRLKGGAASVRIFALDEATAPRIRTTHSTHSSLFGRKEELAILAKHLAMAEDGTGTLVVVDGEPGIGKSILIAQCIEQAKQCGFDVALAQATTIGSGIAWRAWRDAIASTLGVIDLLSDREELQKAVIPALESIATDLGQRAPLLNAILPMKLDESDLTRWMSQEVRGDNTQKLLLQILGNNSQASDRPPKPLLIVFEDAHCADTSSWLLLEQCWETFPHALIVIATRPLGQYAKLALIPDSCIGELDSDTTIKIQLTSLSQAEGERIMSVTLDCESLPQELTDFVNQQAGGHPFYTIELTLALLEAGIIRIVDGTCSITTRLSELRFPDSIEGVITGRIDRLQPFDQQVLKTASVVGIDFNITPLHALLPKDEESVLPPSLGRIESRELVFRHTNTENDQTYSFQHALTQEVGYQLLHHAQRRTLHERLAIHYETHYQHSLGPWHGILAHHWELSDNQPKAVDHLDKAGQLALEQGAFRECLRFYSKAIPLSESQETDKRMALWHSRISSARYRLGDLAEARKAAEQALPALDIPVPRGPRLAVGIAREVLRQTRHRLSPKKFIGQADDARRKELRSSVRLYMTLSELYYLGGEPGLSTYAALRLVNVGELSGESSELLEAYGVASFICGLIGRDSWAESYADLAWKLAEKLDTPLANAIVRHQLSLHQAALGKWDKVREYELEAASIYSHLGDIGRLRDALGLHGTTEYLASNYESGEKLLQALLSTQRGKESFVQKIWGAGWLGAIALKRGQNDKARDWLEESLSLLDNNTVGLMEVAIRGMLAMACERSGQRSRALELAQETFKLIQKSKGRPSGHISLDGYVSTAELFLVWSTDESFTEHERKQHTKQALKMSDFLRVFAKSFPIGKPASWLYAGLQKQVCGQNSAAQKYWKEGQRAAEALNMRFELGQLHRAQASLTSTSRDYRKTKYLSAIQLFKQIGAHDMLQRTLSELEKVV
ncbi:MAG: AAA family ATPase [Kofleriaceae bacterium]|nr:AAA family ATPase [Kofleriaceae bacterium]